MPILPTTGASLHYLREGTGPPALLLQGAGVIGEGWRPQIDALSDRYTLVTLDNRGIGASLVDSPRLVSVEAMARDALAVMDAEGLADFHLAGHSVGGLIAQQVALLAPSRVKSLTLLCSFVDGAQACRLDLGLFWSAVRMWFGSRRARREAFLRVMMPPDYLRGRDSDQVAGRLTPLFGRDLADQPSIVLTQLRAAWRYAGAARWAQLRPVPTLVVSGVQDRISRRRYGQALARAIAGARLVEFPEAGHGVPIQCAAAISDLLDQHWRAADAADTTDAAMLQPAAG